MSAKLIASVICAGIGSCSLLDVKIGSQTIKGSVTSNSVSGGGCGEATGPFSDTELAGGDLLKGDFDKNIACLKSAKFTISAHIDSLAASTAGDSCTGPAGTVGLTSYDLTYDYKDNGTTKTEHVAFNCPDPSLDFSQPVADLQSQIDACMGVINDEGQDKLRVALNRHPDKLKIAGVGTCSAEACFNMKTTLTLKMDDGVVSVGGGCE